MSRNWLIWMFILTFMISPTITWGNQQAEPQWLIVAQDSLVENMLDVTDWQPGEEFIFLYPYPESFSYPWQGEEIISYHYEEGFLWVNGELVGADLFEVGLTELVEPEKILTVISPREYLIELHRLPNLQVLEVEGGYNRDVYDEDLFDIRDLTQLRMLDIGGCEEITDSGLVALENLYQLRVLNLADLEHLTGDGLKYLRNMKTLKRLSLRRFGTSRQDLEGKNLIYLKDLSELKYLNLCGTEIGDEAMPFIGQLENLRELYLQDTEVGNLAHLGNLSKLEALNLSSTGINDDDIKYLANLDSLENLNLGSTQVGDAGVSMLQGLKALKSLFLNQTEITDTALLYLKDLSNLEELDVSGLIFRGTPAKVTDAGLEFISNLKSLRVLDLSNTQITDEGLEYLVELHNLQELELTDTEISDAGLERLKYLRNLRKLDLQATNTIYDAAEQLAEKIPGCRIMPNQGPNVYTFSTGTTYIANPDGSTTIKLREKE